MAVFTGAGVAIATPMNEDESINFDSLAALIERQIEGGIDAIIICGTTGESATLTDEEHIEAIRFAVKQTAGRVPVVAGTGSNDTAHAVALSVEAEKAGADALLLVTPYYNKATQKGLIRHFTRIAEAVKLPVILYNVPSRTGCNILPETAAYLGKNVENIVGIKEASGNISQVAKLMSLAEGSLDLYSGNDDQITAIMSLGGKGVISVLANIAPAQTHAIAQAYLDGDTAKSCELQLKAIELVDALFCEVNPIPVKTALNILGQNAGPLRGPLCEMEEKNVQRLEQAMKNYGLL